MVMLSYVSVVIVRDSEIQNYIEQNWKTQQMIIKPVFIAPDCILDTHINSQYPKWLYQQVEHKYKQ